MRRYNEPKVLARALAFMRGEVKCKPTGYGRAGYKSAKRRYARWLQARGYDLANLPG